MKSAMLRLAVATALCAVSSLAAFAQSAPGWTYGQVPTPAQWNGAFAAKQDYLGAPPLLTTGGVLTGRLVTAAPSSTTAGLNLTPGSTPSTPANGDIWVTISGLYAQVNGVTIGPIGGGSSASFAATSPLSVSFPSGVVTYACSTCGVTTSPLSQFASTTSAQLAGIISNETGSGSLVFANTPTLVTPILGAATATSINGLTISTTTGTLSIANGTTLSLAGGSFTLNSSGSGSQLTGASGKVLAFNNTLTLAGVDSKTLTVNNSLTLAGTDGTTMTFPGASDTVVTLAATQTLTNKTLTSPVLTTPTLGVASGTSLALGGATIGTNALAVTGTQLFGGAQTIAMGADNVTFQTVNGSGGNGRMLSSIDAGGAVHLRSQNGANLSLGVNTTDYLTVATTGVTITTGFTATGLVGYSAMASGALATQAQYFSAAANTLVPTSVIYTSETTTTYGATTTFDFSTFINTAVTLTGNITTMNVANVKAGQAGTITFIQDGTGSRTTVWNSIFKFAGGAQPSLSTAASAVDVLAYSCRSATFCVASLVKQAQ
ncbi:hypothetical protein H8A95_16060 [Bradyrhizobium sp. Pear76]|uniref:beta strand repeat-containing protein n=1 Tax=Bradyrhizobium oropedii TaxID=1571201 RepID=UPI001E44F38F|nr:hypothetical protein [Bradyrhizobium oropedii]MCC8963786.1 hypothetical protein [Bradyrhizobium oropedii]